ncbi:HsdM family class I SAM-dependent methyltransferase [Pyramidobacter piscolens]|uniref:class I SAM-dependent DNA methyltransferase n=1 Tax=Pyramidobacter piscolens TaxID=638849 RepID=UPI0024462D96|nr:class I SAM-dependent DNA methyltransferase [Pyramidobacter piscolens]BDF79015.1 type I restriction endonuclease subunit M [Pyramidobacter piscolens]
MSNISGFVKRIRDIMRNDPGINGDAQRIEQIAWMLFLKVYDAKEQDWDIDEDNYESIIPENCRWANWARDDHSGDAMTGDTLMNFVNNTLFPVLKGQDITDGTGKVLIRGIQVTPDTPIRKSIVQTTFEDANNYMKDGILLRQVINVIDELDLGDYEESHAFGEIYESILKELQSAGSAGEFYTPRAVTDFMAQMIKPQIGEKMADFACGTGGFITSWLKELQKQIRSTADAKKYAESIYGVEKKQFPYMLCITNLLLHGVDLPRVYHENSLIRDVLDYTADDQFDVILMNPPYGGSEKTEVKNHFPADLASSETADLFMAVIMYRLKKNGRCAVILPDGFLFGTDNAKVNLKKKLLSEFNLHTVVRMPGSVFSPYTSITTNILFFDNTGRTEETWFYRLDMPEGYKHFSKTKPMKIEHFAPVVEWWNDRKELIVDGFDKAKKFTYAQLTDEFGYNFDQCGYPHEEEEILDPLDLIQKYEEQRASLNAKIDRVLAEITAILGGNKDE